MILGQTDWESGEARARQQGGGFVAYKQDSQLAPMSTGTYASQRVTSDPRQILAMLQNKICTEEEGFALLGVVSNLARNIKIDAYEPFSSEASMIEEETRALIYSKRFTSEEVAKRVFSVLLLNQRAMGTSISGARQAAVNDLLKTVGSIVVRAPCPSPKKKFPIWIPVVLGVMGITYLGVRYALRNKSK